ncbi:MAG: acetolactate synthase-1/2/3 large subunit, partial [Myxococcota bacterium]
SCGSSGSSRPCRRLEMIMESLTMRTQRPAIPSTVAGALACGLAAIGVRQVFGVSEGGVAHIWSALEAHPALQLIHTQHECGAAFAATEASLATDAPVVVFATTGPGLTNLLTGLVAAR